MNETDLDLLNRYTRQHAEDAFSELVRRHLSLVYSAALRQVRSPQLAEEVAQSTFTHLARGVERLAPDTILTAWLYQVTRRGAVDVVRREARRQAREQIATEMNAVNTRDPNWSHIEPLLDEAMDALDKTDRSAILLRYFENKSLREVGQALGTSEDAAQKRVSRAVERLREFFAHHGVSIGAGGLAALITANAMEAAPGGLATGISSAALATAAVGTGISLPVFLFMTLTKLKLGLGALLVAGVATTLIVQNQAREKLRAENESLRQQITQLRSDNESLSNRVEQVAREPRLAAPPSRASARPVEAAGAGARFTFLAQLYKDGRLPKLTAEQVKTYLQANRRNAASLLAAFSATDDPALLKEAVERYPNDPRVDLMAGVNSSLPVEEQRKCLDAFAKSAPDNALADYLLANACFKSGQNDQAVQEFIDGSGKTQLQDYSAENIQNVKEAYLAAGYSDLQAQAIATFQQSSSELTDMKSLGSDIIHLADSYRQSGDTASAQTVLQMAINLGQESSGMGGGTLIAQLVGLAIERSALAAMDPNSSYGDTGQTVQDQITALDEQKAVLKQLSSQLIQLEPTMSDEDWANYTDRFKSFGEAAAAQWVVNKYGKQ